MIQSLNNFCGSNRPLQQYLFLTSHSTFPFFFFGSQNSENKIEIWFLLNFSIKFYFCFLRPFFFLRKKKWNKKKKTKEVAISFYCFLKRWLLNYAAAWMGAWPFAIFFFFTSYQDLLSVFLSALISFRKKRIFSSSFSPFFYSPFHLHPPFSRPPPFSFYRENAFAVWSFFFFFG